jgi:hypothetical protein
MPGIGGVDGVSVAPCDLLVGLKCKMYTGCLLGAAEALFGWSGRSRCEAASVLGSLKLHRPFVMQPNYVGMVQVSPAPTPAPELATEEDQQQQQQEMAQGAVAAAEAGAGPPAAEGNAGEAAGPSTGEAAEPSLPAPAETGAEPADAATDGIEGPRSDEATEPAAAAVAGEAGGEAAAAAAGADGAASPAAPLSPRHHEIVSLLPLVASGTPAVGLDGYGIQAMREILQFIVSLVGSSPLGVHQDLPAHGLDLMNGALLAAGPGALPWLGFPCLFSLRLVGLLRGLAGEECPGVPAGGEGGWVGMGTGAR